LDIVKDYGADALRTSVILVTPEGQDPCISFNTFELGRNFANKLWNASKFVMANLKDDYTPTTEIKTSLSDLKLEDLWILSRLNRTVEDVTKLMESYKFNSAIKTLYDFVWHDFCDWYVEMVKSRFSLPENDKERVSAQEVTHLVLNNILKLLHPFAPFITEEIWHHLYRVGTSESDHTLMHAEWPQAKKELSNDSLETTMERVQGVVYSIRNIRSEMNVPQVKKANVMVKVDNKNLLNILEENKGHIINLGRVENLKIGMRMKKPEHAASAVIKDAEIFVPLEGLIDLEQERQRLEKELSEVTALLDKTNKKLSNEDFLKRAPKQIIEKERAKKEDFQKMVEKLSKNLEGIVGW
jgi:valyl-tRNA synthetase